MAATNYTPISLYHSTTTTAVPVNTNLVDGELAINITDGKLFYKDNSGTVQVIATKATGTIGGSTTQVQYNNAGVLAGSANFTFNGTTATINTLNLTNALGAAYGGTAQSSYTAGDIIYATGATALAKLGIGLSTYILTSTGSAPQWSAPTAISVSTATNLAGGAAGSVPYQSGAGATTFLAIGTANRVLTSSGTAPQWSTALTGLTSVSSNFDTLGGSGFTLPAVLSATAPAKLYINTSTVTDGSSAIGATNALGAITSFDATTVAATNANVTYTNLATLVINAVPVAGTNVTITNPYALYVAAGASYFGSTVTVNGTVNATTLDLTNLEVTNIKAKDGTAAIVLTDSTGAVTISTALTANGGAVFNENGADVDFRVEGDTDANLIFADASADKVGIGTSSPGYKLDVESTTTNPTIRIRSNGGVIGNYAELLLQTFNSFSGVGQAYVRGVSTASGNSNTDLTFGVNASGFGSPYEAMRLTSTGTLNIVGAGTAGSTQAISFNGSTPVDTLVTDSSGRVGIGTSSPGTKTQIQGAVSTNNEARFLLKISDTSSVAQGNGGGLIFQGVYTGTTLVDAAGLQAYKANSTDNNYSYGLAFTTRADGGNLTANMRLDASGNLGLGVTPSAWNAGGKIIEVGSAGNILFGTANATGLTQNASYISGWKYQASAAATYYEQYAGSHIWYRSTSAQVAGTDPSFNQAMTLDASGNLLVGNTAQSGTANRAAVFSANKFGLSIIDTTAQATGVGGALNLGGNYRTTGDAQAFCRVEAAKENSTDNNFAYAMAFSTTPNGGTFTERARIDSSGHQLIGYTSSVGTAYQPNVQVKGSSTSNYGAYGVVSSNNEMLGFMGVWSHGENSLVIVADPDNLRTSSSIVFSTDGVANERARITSGGYFKASNDGNYVEVTNCHELRTTEDARAVIITSTNASYTSDVVQIRAARNTTNNSFYAIGYYNTGAAAYKFRVADSGDVTNTNGTYGTISDQKMKTDIVDAGSQWSDIKALRFRKFKMKDDPSGLVQLGVVAQEVEQTSPGLVDEHTDRDAEGNDLGTTTKSVKTSVLLMKAAVALQEAMARIETLEAEVAALKGA